VVDVARGAYDDVLHVSFTARRMGSELLDAGASTREAFTRFSRRKASCP
jgi:hypothetical protein